MSTSSASKLSLAFALGSTWWTQARAEDQVTLATNPYAELTAENKAADLELGLAFDRTSRSPDTLDWKLQVRPYVRVPFSNADEQLVRLDKYSSAVKAGFGMEWEWRLSDTSNQTSHFMRLVTEAELGTKKYTYTPLGAMSATSERHQAFSANVEAIYGFTSPSAQFAPQLAVTYNRSYEAADAIGIVVPGSNGSPDTVDTMVVEAPSVAPALSVRMGTPLYGSAIKAPIGFGLYGVGAWTGNSYRPWGEQQRLRGELWTYLFPNSPANSRAGIAVFAESARAASGEDRTTSYGLFVQLKLNTTLFAY